jgi:hypothetical protein
MPAKLKYHSAIFQLLGRTPVVSPARVALIEDRESDCGVRFPRSVSEWYSLEEAETLFGESNDPDRLVPLERLGDPAEVSLNYLKLMEGSAGSNAVYARLKGGGRDDPELRFAPHRLALRDVLLEDAWAWPRDRLASYVFTALTAIRYDALHPEMDLYGTDAMPGKGDLKKLRKQFREGPYGPGDICADLRFFNEHGIVYILSMPVRGDADWTLRANTPEDLYELGRTVWGYGTLAKTLKARPKARKVLQRLRAASP